MTRRTVDEDLLRNELVAIVGERRLSLQPSDLSAYSRDMWPKLLIGMASGHSPPPPHAVVWPETEREVAAVVKVAGNLGLPIIPYGGGSGVCGGVVPIHGGITIDLKRMCELRSVSRDEMMCDVEAGINGERFERQLNFRGYTLGHFPSSIYCSTVGGWLACRAAGQMSTKYGKIEDRVAGMTVVTGRGDIVHTDGPTRAVSGPNWNQLIVGSEGTLGIITSARLRVSPTPALRVMRGFEVDDVEQGAFAIRRIMQRGLRPAVVRLYDEVDTFLNYVAILGKTGKKTEDDGDSRGQRRLCPVPEAGDGALPAMPGREVTVPLERSLLSRARALLSPSSDHGRRVLAQMKREALGAALSRPKLINDIAGPVAEKITRKGCRLIIGLEGSRIRTEVEARLTFDELEHAGARDLGEEPGQHWLEHRYDVSFKMSPVFRSGLFVDTMEVAATWDRLLDLYRAVKSAIGKHAMVMAHFSHAYPDGCSIYFTFVASCEDPARAEHTYDAIWRDGMAAASRTGGTISHHHGIGLLKGPAMISEHREAMTILDALKQSFDPLGILNPGKLGLPARIASPVATSEQVR